MGNQINLGNILWPIKLRSVWNWILSWSCVLVPSEQRVSCS